MVVWTVRYYLWSSMTTRKCSERGIIDPALKCWVTTQTPHTTLVLPLMHAYVAVTKRPLISLTD